VTLSRGINKSSSAFLLFASGIWFASSRVRLKNRAVVSARPTRNSSGSPGGTRGR
jgi:hypothetical protein